MQILFEFLEKLGIHINEETNIFILFISVILILNVIVLLCVVNILMYASLIYYFKDESKLNNLLHKLPSVLGVIVKKIIYLYKKTSMYFILLEVILLFFSLCSAIGAMFKVVYYSQM